MSTALLPLLHAPLAAVVPRCACRQTGFSRAPRALKQVKALRTLLLAALIGLGLLAAGPQAAGWHDPALQTAAQRLGADGLRAAAELRRLQQQLQPSAATVVRVHALASDGGAAVADLQRLHTVNDFFNTRVRFAADIDNWGVEDHWTTPLELLARGRGDCEDYAIAKYALLVAAGMPAARLRLVYVRARLPPTRQGAPDLLQPHMVLAYHAQPGDEPLILDNLRPDILPAGQRPDLMPVFSFNSEGLWDAVTAQPAGHPLVRLSRWRDLVQRMRVEGLHL